MVRYVRSDELWQTQLFAEITVDPKNNSLKAITSISYLKENHLFKKELSAKCDR